MYKFLSNHISTIILMVYSLIERIYKTLALSNPKAFFSLTGLLTISGMVSAAPPLLKPIFIGEERMTALSVTYLSSTIPLKGLRLSSNLFDLTKNCVGVAFSEKRISQSGGAYLSGYFCDDEEATGEVVEGDGQIYSIGYVFGSTSGQLFVEGLGSKSDFASSQENYELSIGSVSIGVFFTPFRQTNSNIILNNFSFGADYSFAKVREKREVNGELERNDNGKLVSDVALLTRWSYAFRDSFGVSISGEFVGRESIGALLYITF